MKFLALITFSIFCNFAFADLLTELDACGISRDYVGRAAFSRSDVMQRLEFNCGPSNPSECKKLKCFSAREELKSENPVANQGVNNLPNIKQSTSQSDEMGLHGMLRCRMKVMVDMNSRRETQLKGNDIWVFAFEKSKGIVFYPVEGQDLLLFESLKTFANSNVYVYTIANSATYERLHISIDKGKVARGSAAVILDMRPVANMKVSTLGFCGI